MLHLRYCHNADSLATDSEIRELARRLERGDNIDGFHGTKPVGIKAGSREAALCVEALRRVA